MTGSSRPNPPPQPVREEGAKAVRPSDAATIIIWRKQRRRIEVLMGERHRAHKFLPHRYVFPGGRVDGSDARIRSANEMHPAVAAQLARTTPKGRGRSIAVAAISSAASTLTGERRSGRRWGQAVAGAATADSRANMTP